MSLLIIHANPASRIEGQALRMCPAVPRGARMSRRTIGCQVGDLAAEFHVNPRTIRYYDRIGLLEASTRTPAGYRLYSGADRDRLRFILKQKRRA